MIHNTLAAAAGLLLVGAISPGPNNLIVLRAAAQGGVLASWPAIAGIVLGGLAMLLLVAVGMESAILQSSQIRLAIAVGGASYLCWLGIGLLRVRAADGNAATLPTRLIGLFCFQFLNPKSWVLALSLVAAFPHAGVHTVLVHLAPLFLVIPTACLLLWALAGRSLSAHMRVPAFRRSADRLMGSALIVSAILLLI